MAKIAYTYGTLKAIRGFALNRKDGLQYELFEVIREPITEMKRWFFNLFVDEEIVGWKQDESQLRLMALEKMKACLTKEFFDTYSDYTMKEYREVWDSFTNTSTDTNTIFLNDKWLK